MRIIISLLSLTLLCIHWLKTANMSWLSHFNSFVIRLFYSLFQGKLWSINQCTVFGVSFKNQQKLNSKAIPMNRCIQNATFRILKTKMPDSIYFRNRIRRRNKILHSTSLCTFRFSKILFLSQFFFRWEKKRKWYKSVTLNMPQ